MKVTITGDKALLSKLSKLRKTQAKKAIRVGSRAGSKIIQSAAKENVPVVTGALRTSIKVRALPRSRKWTGTQVTTRVEGGVPYASFVELGTHRMKARKFIKGAVEQAGATAAQTFIDGIASEIDKL